MCMSFSFTATLRGSSRVSLSPPSSCSAQSALLLGELDLRLINKCSGSAFSQQRAPWEGAFWGKDLGAELVLCCSVTNCCKICPAPPCFYLVAPVGQQFSNSAQCHGALCSVTHRMPAPLSFQLKARPQLPGTCLSLGCQQGWLSLFCL